MDHRTRIALFATLLAVSVPAAAETFTTTVATYFKQSTAQASDLPAAKKCYLAQGAKIGATNHGIVNGHYNVTLAGPLGSCGFSYGYLFKDHVTVAGGGGSGYTLPLANGQYGSGWCVCRSVGTSPHIGQDLNSSDSPERAVAIAAGRIESVSFDASCGYILSLRDGGGALWRYVHLNSPAVGQGASVSKGQQIATISAYPKAACGTGPHLHYERRSAGAFGDGETGKNCGQGYRSCYWDPIKPFRSSKTAAAASPVQVASAPTTAMPALACKVAPSAYASVDAGAFAGLPSTRAAGLQVTLDYVARNGQRVAVASAAFAGNAANACRADRGNCVTGWTLYNQSRDGTWRRVFHDPATLNVPARRVAEEATCAADGFNGRSVLVVRDRKGQRYAQAFDAK